MKKITMNINNGITFAERSREYILNCKARNLRDGTIKHYRDSIRQILKYIDADTPIESMNKQIVENFIVELRGTRVRKRDPDSVKFVTDKCIVSVNPNTGILIQCNPQ
ncbi:hypothetical protein [Faecalimonas sp.]